MTFTEFLRGFAEPGFVFTLMVAFTLAYFVALKANPLWQVGLCIFFASYAATQWANGTQWTLALGWVYCGWAGFAFQKIGGGILLSGLANRLKKRFQAWSTPAPPQSTDEPRTESRRSDRGKDHRKRQEDFKQRERQRGQREKNSDKSHKKAQPPEPEPTKPQSEKKAEAPPPSPSKPTKRPWWEVLEISSDSDVTTIKKAYRTMIQKYHPDRVSHLGKEFQIIAEEKSKEINLAFKESPARK